MPMVNAATQAATAPAVAPSAFADRIALFKYDSKADLGLKEAASEKRGNVTVRDLTFVGAPGKVINAYLVVPNGTGPFAGVLWVHWLGDPKTTNRTEFLDEAVALAPKGVVSLLVDAMWAKSGWYDSRVLEEDYANSVNQVIDLRRAMDLLSAQPQVDKARIAVVGHDYGGMYSVILAGVDPRAKTYVFVAATPSLNDWAFYSKQPKSMDDYLKQNAVLELKDYLREVKSASVFMQFAEQDQYVPLAKADEFFQAANATKQMKVYAGAGHDMVKPAAVMTDRDAWLTAELGLK